MVSTEPGATLIAMPLLAAFLGAVAISFSAIFYELSGVSPVTGALFRTVYALPVLMVLWWRVRTRDNRSHKARWLAAGAGMFLAFDFVSWHLSIGYIGTGLATLIANSQVVVVALVAWLLLGETPSRQISVAVPVVLVGVALVTGLGRADAFGSEPLLGAALGVASAVGYAFYLLGLRRSNRVHAPAVGPLLDATAGAAVTTLVLAPLIGNLDLVPSWPAHGWLLAVAIVSQVGGWTAISYALPRLPATETSTFILVQPVLTMAWGMLIFVERPSLLQLFGAAVVLSGVGMVAWSSNRRQTVIAAT